MGKQWPAWIAARSAADYGVWAVWMLIAALAFGLQAPNIGFYGPNHGWTSSHGLAIMRHATPANGFVGYTLQYRATDGSLAYSYFDRYAPFFSVGMNALMSLSDSLPVRVQLARQAMNAVYVATLFAAWRLALRFVPNRFAALGAVILAFSGWWMVFYKDMIHYDQPALLGAFWVLNALAAYYLDGKRWPIYAVSLVAVAMGRGYASYAIIGLWGLSEAWRVLRDTDIPLLRRVGRVFTLDAARVTLLVILWGASFLAYNVTVESRQRGIPVAQTSVIDSANRRLPVGDNKDAGRTIGKGVPAWPEFAARQSDRFARWQIPHKLPANTVWVNALTVALWALALTFIARQPADGRRTLAAIVALWGMVWLALMINLSHGHEYTMMYGVGLALIAYLLLADGVARSRWTVAAWLLISLAAFTYANASVRAELMNPQTNRAVYTYDYQRIAERISGDGRSVYVNISDGECVIEDNFCYVLGFYLDEHYLSAFENADYVLNRSPYYAEPVHIPPDDTDGLLLLGNTLTPENTTAHLLDKATAQRLTIPADARPLFTFGDALTLQHWHLRESVEVSACQYVNIESWWTTTAALPDNYSMLIALQNVDGEAVASANHDLTHLPTQIWQPDDFHLDSRPLQIPCDAPAGEYALVMSVYALDAPASLPVTTADGTPNSDYVYMTTLFVR